MHNACDIRDLFDRCATAYDQDRPKLVPGFAQLYGAALQALPQSAVAPEVLDLGAGTGLFAAMVAAAYPQASIHLTDLSAAMLAQARLRFQGNPRISYAVQDHLQLNAPAAYDLVISALSIHHLEDADKRRLFEKIYQALRPGGLFVNVDQVRGPSAAEEEVYAHQWLAEVRAAGVSDAALQQAQERMQVDRNALLTDQLAWLADAGFAPVECWYSRGRFAVFGGWKRG